MKTHYLQYSYMVVKLLIVYQHNLAKLAKPFISRSCMMVKETLCVISNLYIKSEKY